jgi:hypothetical protein
MVVRGSSRSRMNHFVNLEDYGSIMGKRYRILVCKYFLKKLEIDNLCDMYIFSMSSIYCSFFYTLYIGKSTIFETS